MKTSSTLRLLLLAAAAVLALSLPHQAHAQFREWINGGTTNWSTAGNWGGGAYAFAQLEWKGNGSTTSWNDLSSPQSQWRFYFSGSTAYTLGGNAVSFFNNSSSRGGILSDASVTQTINMDLNFADNGARDMFILTRGAGGLTFGGAINLTNSMTSLGIGGSNAASVITFNGPITGNKGIIIGTNAFDGGGVGMGPTRVVFNGSNSYTGTTHVGRGTLVITNNNSIGTNNLILGLNGSGIQATLEVNSSLNRTNIVAIHDGGINSQISVASGQVFTISTNLINSSGATATTKFGKAGAGTLLLAGTASTYAGQIQIGDGTVVIGSSASLGTNITTATRGIDLGLNVNDANQTNNVSLLLSNGVVLSNSIFVSPNTISGTNYTRTIGLSGSGSATINNQIFLGGNLTLDAATGNTLTVSGNITNTGGLIKVGDGTLILSGANNYSGGTLVSGGTLQGSTTSLQGNITNNAVLLFSNTSAGTYSGALSGIGSLTKAGTGAVTLSNVNTYTGGTIIVADSLIAGVNGSLGTGVLTFSNANTARLNLNGTTNTVTGLSFLGAGIPVIQNETGSAGRLIIDLASGTASTTALTQIRNGTSGTLALTKTGGGTLDLSVITTSAVYSGGLTVNAGTLGFGAATNAVGSGAITLGGGTLRYTATGSTNATLNNTFSLTPATSSSVEVADSTVALSISNVISGSGALIKSGAGTLILGTNSVNDYSGGTLVSAGTLQGSTTSLQGNITNNSVLLFNQATNGTYSGALSGNGSLTKAGAGAVTLSNVNTYTGGTIIVADSLIAGVNGSLGTGVLTFSNANTARLNLNGTTNTITGLTFSGLGAPVIQNESVSGAGRLVIDLASGTTSTPANTIIRDRSSGSLLGTLALTKNGAGTLDLSAISSSSAYSGGLTVNAGTLGFGAATNAVGSGAITLGGGTLRYTATGSTNSTLANLFTLASATTSGIVVTDSTVALTISNVISGGGGLTKAGNGTLTLSGANTYTGDTTIAAGVLDLNSATGSALGVSTNVTVSATLLISQSGQVSDSAVVTLSGGTIQRGAGVSEVFGNLNITGSGILDFGTGATGNLTFGTYQDNAATPSALLTLNNFLPGNSFTFSSTSFSTNSVGSYFSFGTGYVNSSISNSDSTFTITAIPEPSTVAAALGLCALLGWPVVRRRLGKSKI